MIPDLRARLNLLLLVTVFSGPFFANAQIVSGLITDENNSPVPYATIYVPETKEGTTSNIEGKFQFQLPPGTYHFTVRSMGYLQNKLEVVVQSDSMFLPITMKVQEFEIKEIKVFPGKEDPSYFIMRKAMAKAPYYRSKIKSYTADLYIKSNFEFTNIPKVIEKQEIEDGMRFKDVFKENVTYVIESQNKITYNYPDQYDQKVISKRTSLTGFDEPPVMGLMTANFYNERPFQVISPLSSMALEHYVFRYEGFISVGDRDVFKIKVTPKRKSDELVEGYIYIVDKLWCIYNLDFSSTFEFFDYHFKQQFENTGDDNWLPVSHNISGKVGMLGLRGTFYYGASVKYSSIVNNYELEKGLAADATADEQAPVKREQGKKEQELNKELDQLNAKEELNNSDVRKVARINRKILKEQYKDSTIVAADFGNYNISDDKDSLQTIDWDTVRAIPLTPAELESYERADSLMGIKSPTDTTSEEKGFDYQSLGAKILFGYYALYRDSVFRFGYDGLLSPVNFDFNAVDGYKYQQRFRMRFTTKEEKHIYVYPTIGYAFNREALFGLVNVRFIDILREGNRVTLEFGKQSKDFKPEGTGIQPLVNAVSSWFFGENYMRLYETEFFEMNMEQRLNNFRLYAGLDYNHFYPLENNISYPLSKEKEFEPNLPKGLEGDHPALEEQKSFTYKVGLRYGKRQRKPWLEESPFLFVGDFYNIRLSYHQGLSDIFNSVSDFSSIDLVYQQEANISPRAGMLWKLNAGYFINNDHLHFSQYKHFQTAETPVAMRPYTYTLQTLNDYEFSTSDSYFNVGFEYRTEYILLRYLSFLNQKTWSESLYLNYLTTPDLSNYWELGYSINNLFFVGNIGVFAGFKESDFESIAVKLTIPAFD